MGLAHSSSSYHPPPFNITISSVSSQYPHPPRCLLTLIFLQSTADLFSYFYHILIFSSHLYPNHLTSFPILFLPPPSPHIHVLFYYSVPLHHSYITFILIFLISNFSFSYFPLIPIQVLFFFFLLIVFHLPLASFLPSPPTPSRKGKPAITN